MTLRQERRELKEQLREAPGEETTGGGRVYVYINTVMDNIDTVSGSEISSISVY